MGTGPADGPSGYQVNPSTLQQASQAAQKLAETMQTLVGTVDKATDLPPAPKGLGVGQSLNDIKPMWEAHLLAITTDLRALSTNLADTATEYTRTENSISTSMHDIGH